ncbi:hypothetical protein R3W88_010502 [Solanum pinnatisectum]|uniref:Late embryogenesis abundant protein LEA-2 subgroup domain-containing protein n=1 Tax=Solanum pinnatisectum TaxID=50273 RepID=A0AAV9MDS9_9SOLN|nr:hypothetical protein R3W88_010502 [Solanum pinnatisectum]
MDYISYYYQAFSFKKCLFFLFTFIFLIALLVVIIPSFLYLILKPQNPNFTLQTLKVQSYNLNVSNPGSDPLFSSVIGLTLLAQNPNKVGIRYKPTRFHVFNEGVVIGMIQVPAFYQPPRSSNLTLETRAIFYFVNVTQILSNISLQQNSSTKSVTLASILGDVKAQVKLFNVNLPKVKLAVECTINIDQNYIKLSNQMVYSLKAGKSNTISLPMNNIRGSFSNKCTASIYI